MSRGSFAIVPVREYRTTKTRLSRILSESERASLTEALLVHVLRAIQESELSGGIIVSSDPDETSIVASKFDKIRVIRESRLHGGVNSAVEDGIYALNNRGQCWKILVMPSDLPLLTSKAINGAIELLDSCDLVINPSSKKDGTNLLAFAPSKRIRLFYDQDSYPNHLKEAKSMHLKFAAIEWKEFSCDLDDLSDLEKIKQELKVRSVIELLNSL